MALEKNPIGYVNKDPIMHHFGDPRHTQSMIVYIILTENFWKFQSKVALWEPLTIYPFTIDYLLAYLSIPNERFRYLQQCLSPKKNRIDQTHV